MEQSDNFLAYMQLSQNWKVSQKSLWYEKNINANSLFQTLLQEKHSFSKKTFPNFTELLLQEAKHYYKNNI